jgi:hypothetical protein
MIWWSWEYQLLLKLYTHKITSYGISIMIVDNCLSLLRKQDWKGILFLNPPGQYAYFNDWYTILPDGCFITGRNCLAFLRTWVNHRFWWGLCWWGLCWWGLCWWGLCWWGLCWWGLCWWGLCWWGLCWYYLTFIPWSIKLTTAI